VPEPDVLGGWDRSRTRSRSSVKVSVIGCWREMT
jgi:hypothetical protein